MQSDPETQKLLCKVAKAYYEDGLTQQVIGQRFGLSRIKVSRLLSQAREQHVIQISIATPPGSYVELEHELEGRYALDEAIVVPPQETPQALHQALGLAAASCLVRSLQGHETLALTWGNTLLSTVAALPANQWPEMRVVQMLGGLGHPEADVYGADLVHRAAQTFGAKARMLAAPGIVASPEVRAALLADAQIAGTLALAAQADIALVGIGRPTVNSVVMQSNILTEAEFAALQALGAVGDIGLRFFDADGRAIPHAINDRIIGLTLEQIRAIPRVIGVAGGPEKFEVIRAALRGQLINVLVTDEDNARRLVEDGVGSKE